MVGGRHASERPLWGGDDTEALLCVQRADGRGLGILIPKECMTVHVFAG